MHWRNREKRNDQEHYEKASFFHLAGFKNGFFCFVFEKMENVFFTSCVMLLDMLVVHVKKPRWNSRSQMFFKVQRKTPVFESLFNKVAGLKACIFIKKETPTQVFSCEYCETFTNSLFTKHLFIILFRNFMWW